MARGKILNKDQEIYTDYLVAILTGQPLWTVADKYKIHLRQIHLIKNRVEARNQRVVGKNMRGHMWNTKYKLLWERPQNTYGVKNAIMRDMYYKSGFDTDEIALLTGCDLTKVEKVVS